MSLSAKLLMPQFYLFASIISLSSLVPDSFKIHSYTYKIKTFARSIMYVSMSCIRSCCHVSISYVSRAGEFRIGFYFLVNHFYYFSFFQLRMLYSSLLTSFHCQTISDGGFLFTEKPKGSKQ